jgi:hypothetical protein
MYYGLNVDDKKKVVFELLGIVPLTDEVKRLVVASDAFTVDMAHKFDYVRYSEKGFMFYSKEYLEKVDIDEFIKRTAKWM